MVENYSECCYFLILYRLLCSLFCLGPNSIAPTRIGQPQSDRICQAHSHILRHIKIRRAGRRVPRVQRRLILIAVNLRRWNRKISKSRSYSDNCRGRGEVWCCDAPVKSSNSCQFISVRNFNWFLRGSAAGKKRPPSMLRGAAVYFWRFSTLTSKHKHCVTDPSIHHPPSRLALYCHHKRLCLVTNFWQNLNKNGQQELPTVNAMTAGQNHHWWHKRHPVKFKWQQSLQSQYPLQKVIRAGGSLSKP